MLIKLVAERLTEGAREQLLNDMASVLVREEGDFLRVELPNYERPKYRGHQNLPFEGKLHDLQGEPVSVLLNTENDRLVEIEFIWWSSPSGTGLDWSTLEIADASRSRW
jgi:hypothetical protein